MEICSRQNSSMKKKTKGTTIASIVLQIYTGQNSSMKKKKQWVITQKLSKQELQLMSTALPLNEIYPHTKFHNHS